MPNIKQLLFFTIIAILLPLEAVFSFSFSAKRQYLHIVGSSTVSPFMASISEDFSQHGVAKIDINKSPIVESTGTGPGFKAFCAGVGLNYPDLANASRQITRDEIQECEANGVSDITEIKIGYDGIVFGNAITAKKAKFRKKDIFLALSQQIIDEKSGQLIPNPYQKWSEIDSDLPDVDILVYGPPLTSGTRDVFTGLVMKEFCFDDQRFKAAYPDDQTRKAQCFKMRNDGKYVDSGENDYVILQHLKENPNAFGIFGFHFLMASRNKIQAALIDNVEPSFENISYRRYQITRPLFVYFKSQHLDLMPEMRDFIKNIISKQTIGKKGYLIHNGLISVTDSELEQIRKYVLMQLK